MVANSNKSVKRLVLYPQLMLQQELELGRELELELERELGWELEPGLGLQQGRLGSEWTCSKETETLCGLEWGWVWGCSPSLFGRQVRCNIKVGVPLSVS